MFEASFAEKKRDSKLIVASKTLKFLPTNLRPLRPLKAIVARRRYRAHQDLQLSKASNGIIRG